MVKVDSEKTVFCAVEETIRAKYPALYLLSHEETRVLAELGEVSQCLKQKLVTWSMASGIRQREPDGKWKDIDREMTDPMAALEWISKQDDATMFVLLEFNEFISEDPLARRMFREKAEELKTTQKTLVVLSPIREIPDSLEKILTVIDIMTPSRDEFHERLDVLIARLSSKQQSKFVIEMDEDDKAALVNAALGLTRSEFDQCIGRALVANKALDQRAIKLVAEEKRLIVQKSGLLQFFDSEESMEHVGGLDLLKRWMKRRTKAFGQEARDYGLEPPKGVLMVGIAGCGKSLVAKAVASMWRLPLLRLDMGALFGGLVGQSEENSRKVIKLAETIAPCVIWLDEIEKGMAGLGSSGHSDGGTTARVLSTFLTWMAEKKSSTFVVATANDTSQLPPELLRKGRFDEIFAIDIPSEEERGDIVGIHLRKRGRDPENFDLKAIQKVTKDFTGAELEEAVKAGMFAAFSEDREVGTDDILAEIKATVPMAVTMRERIDALREWAQSRARPASSKAIAGNVVDSEKSTVEAAADDLDVFDD